MARPISAYGIPLIVVSMFTLGVGADQKAASNLPTGITPEVVAEYIYALVQADRTLYTTHVVERMEELGKAVAMEHWKSEGALPLPVQMVQMAGEDIKGQGVSLRIRLASLSPINQANGPADDFERAGLEKVAKDHKGPYRGLVNQDGQRVFKAIYADRAVSHACITCHSSQRPKGRPLLKLYEVMGGIIISFPAP